MTTVEIESPVENEIYDKILDDCICLQIKKSARTLTNLYDRALLTSKINSGQFSILLKIAALKAPTLNVLADQLNLKSSTMSRALSPLERDGLISMSRGKDKRTRRVQVSQEGQKTINKAIPLWKRAHDKVSATISANASEGLNGNLDTLSKLPY